MIKNFRGHFVDVSIPASSEPHFDGIDFSTKEKKFHLLFSIKLMIYLLLASFHPFLPRFCMIMLQLIISLILMLNPLIINSYES